MKIEVVRKALEEEIKKVEEERLSKEFEELSSSLKGRITKEDIVKAVRSSRDERGSGNNRFKYKL